MIRPPWRRWTLRTRMVVAVVALAGVALLVTDFVAATTLRHYLAQQLDEDLRRLPIAWGQGRGNPSGWGSAPSQQPGRPAATPTPQPSPSNSASPSGQTPTAKVVCETPETGTNRGVPPVGDDAAGLLYSADGRLQRCATNGIALADLPVLTLAQLQDNAGPAIGREPGKPFPAENTKAPFTVENTSGQKFRVVVNRTFDGEFRVGAISLDRVAATANLMLLIGLGVGALVLLVLGFAAYTVVRIGLRPLTNMEHAAAQIAGGDLTARVPDPDPHTEPGRLGLALNTMLSRIEAAVTARAASEQRLRQFLADASHELRTPLTSIRGFAELYRRGGAPPGAELDETMSRIEQEAARMGLLVEDLLLLAALDEERPLQQSRVDLLAVAADTVRDAHVRTPGRNVELAGFEPVSVQGDEHRLRQVVTNLVANALQHTPPDARVTLRVSHRGGEPADEVFELPMARDSGPVVAAVGADLGPDLPVAVIEVEDSGPGVPPEHAARIFERLYRADPHRARSHGGAGLGLAIASAIVKAHGGRIELATSPGVGSTFRVLLPLDT
ncbi:HAMP domain-containing sensor histidine kinase [Catellatospora sp. NPDC049111]|uniref:sensor histidine kinase n=1 Tax=Catellatospora sp. NPDC049111 TaxID=3155271 RepID=UPI0033FD22E4